MPKAKRRPKHKNMLAVSIPIVLVLSILIIYYVYTHSSSSAPSSSPLNQQYISVYVDGSTYRVSKNDIASIVSKVIKDNQRESINLIAFGATTCPFCRNLHEFFEKYFKDKCLFLWIDDPNNADLFRNLAKIEQNNGLPPSYAYSVPQTIVVKHGEPIAIVIGGITDASFWQNLLSA
ncbi:MAG: hypothetical protein QXJ56_01740 [Ignisphaera sp.]|uniref:Thioredoxin n=1 Tax=Ignisphaera aggregans TaxID=334771 RepID=A0A7J3JS43_9CREN